MLFSDIPSAAPTPTPAAKAPEAPKAEAPTVEETVAPELKVGSTEKVAPTPVSKRKYTVSGKEIELSDEESTAWVQKAIHADAQIKEAAQLKKQTAALVEKLKTPNGLREILSDPSISMDRKALAIEWVKEFMEEEAMDPKDREIKTAKQRLSEYEAKEKAEKERVETEAKQAEIKQQADAFRNEIVEVMEAHKDVLPKSQAVMDRIIGYMRAGYRKTGKVLPASEAVKYVLADYETEFSETTKGADVARLLKLLGPDVIDKIRKADLEKLKASLNPGTAKAKEPELHKDVKKDKKGRISEKEFRKQIFGGL